MDLIKESLVDEDTIKELGISHVILKMAHFMSILLIMAIFMIPIYPILLDSFGISSTSKDLDNQDFLIIGLIVAPIFEELIFRLPLSKKMIQIGVSIIMLLILILAIDPVVVKIILCFFIITLIISKFTNSFINDFHLIIISTIAFASIHVMNYNYENSMLFLVAVPILLMMQLVFGFFAAIIRIHGIQFAILFHFIYNLLIFILSEISL